MTQTKTHYRTCNLCEAMCGVAIEHDGRHVSSIRGDEEDVFSRGHICPKAVALSDLHEDPDRLRRPIARTTVGSARGAEASRWTDVAWDEALDDIAHRIVDIQARHGKNAVALYVGNPTVHNLGALLYGLGFIKSLSTKNRFSATSVDQLPHMLAALEMFGHQLLLPVPDVDRSDYLIIMGANPLVSNGSIMTAPGIKKRLEGIQRRGGKVIVVDPRKTETAKLADSHLYIRPGTDGLLLAAMIHTLFDEGLTSPGRLAPLLDGLGELETLMAPFSPERVAARTGIEAAAIRDLVRGFAKAQHPACYGRMGVCTQRFGGLNAWLLNAFNAVAGSLDEPGGMMFTTPAADLVALAGRIGQTGHFDKGKSRVRGLSEFGGEYPVAVLSEEIEEPGDGQIKALITMAGNPVLSTPNGRRLDRAMEKLELMVSIDIYKNETTRHAHYILPSTSSLEQSHYDLAFHAFAVRNTAKYSPPLFAPPRGAKADWEILLELGTRISIARGGAEAVTARATRAALRRLGPDGILDKLLRIGPYGGGLRDQLTGKGLSLDKLRKSPHGIDFGPLEPRLPDRMLNERIPLVPPRIAKDMPRLLACLDDEPTGLLLIGRRQLRTNNSWLHNSPRMIKGRDRCTLMMHPDDASERGLSHEQRVAVTSRVGKVVAPLHVSDQVMPGVVSLPHGFGHDRPGADLNVAASQPGASANDLTDEDYVDALTGTAALNGVPVSVEAADEQTDQDAAQ